MDLFGVIYSFLQISLCRQLFRDPRLCDIEEIMAEISYFPGLRGLIRAAVRDTVWGSSIRQTIQGLMTAGLGRSWQYAKEKLRKGRDGRKARKEAAAHGDHLKEDSPEMKTFQRPMPIPLPVQEQKQVKIQVQPGKESEAVDAKSVPDPKHQDVDKDEDSGVVEKQKKKMKE